MKRLRRLTHCDVPGHGTWCEVAQESPNFYARCTEERLELEYELRAEIGTSDHTLKRCQVEP